MAKRILIADDDERVRRALVALITTLPDTEVCGEASTGHETVDMALGLRPDLIIIDLKMPGLNGIEAVAIIRKHLPQTKTILFTAYEEYLGRKLASVFAVDVVLRKGDDVSSLISAIHNLLNQNDAPNKESSSISSGKNSSLNTPIRRPLS